MKPEHSSFLRVTALVLALILLLPVLFACKKESAASEVPSLTVDESGEMTFSLRLDAVDLQAHTGQTAYLYELLPGEDLSAINGKASMLRGKVSSKISFTFPVTDENGADRRCNSYLLTFSDGTVYSDPVYLSNPHLLAKNTEAFPHSNTIKGMNAENEELSLSLHGAHTLIPLSAVELVTGDSPTVWNGISLSLNSGLLAQTDGKVASAARAGMQISLELTVGEEVPVAHTAALINLLLERYSTKESGTVTALILKNSNLPDVDETYSASVSRMATLMRVAHTAMVSRVQNGRIYLGADATVNHLKTYTVEVYNIAKKIAPLSFGVALYPDPLTASLAPERGEPTDSAVDHSLILSDLNDTVEDLSDEMGSATRFAVLGLAIPAEDPELQSALYAYAYRASLLAKADFLIYSTPVGEETGLYDGNGTARPAAECFALADTADNVVAEALAAELLGEEWTSLKSVRAARVHIKEIANAGVSDDLGKRYFDFAEGNNPGFTAAGGATAPTVVRSDLWQTSVLTASVPVDFYGKASGFRYELPDVKKLEDAHVMSANVLPQASDAEQAEITLHLNGTASDGRRISLTSAVTLSCNTWQSVTFHIRSFTTQLNPDAPCTMTLTMKPLTEQSEDAEGGVQALWLHSVNLRGAAADHSVLILVGLILGGFAVGFSVMLPILLRKRKVSKSKKI